VTLREAEAATGIPVNTLRKWVRRAGVSSYLESDGETQVRMIDLDAVVARAAELGRHIELVDADNADTDHGAELHLTLRDTGPATPSHVVEEPAQGTVDGPSVTAGGETMIVPIDAWNKMLTQLGNLHEAGQQLADARERAAKAETEATFLRQRLAEMRTGESDATVEDSEEALSKDPVSEDPVSKDPVIKVPAGDREATTAPGAGLPSTTSYWRYVTTGWRSRKRR
jgi:hypothetical protein